MNLDDTSGTYGSTSIGGVISHEFITTDKTTSGLELLNTRDYNKYILKVEVTTTPTLYQLIEYTQPIQVWYPIL